MIFPAVWNVLPGPTAAKLAQLVVLALLVLAVLFTWVFPWMADTVLPAPDGTIGLRSPSSPPGSST
ncbi:hypothetical protein J2Y89_001593 [Curtobacterium herbarum]|uniref:hypothetical protein n=1 Tax=Curtobacterium herbarum TaxID=150122 RepID=UPI00209EA274|nr:hypothetical protein [Curtobacterium herbarum]MCP1502849.1 hypothetical protein [Curtobacterium herbarum]